MILAAGLPLLQQGSGINTVILYSSQASLPSADLLNDVGAVLALRCRQRLHCDAVWHQAEGEETNEIHLCCRCLQWPGCAALWWAQCWWVS